MWKLSEYDVPKRHDDSPVFPRLQEKAEFIVPNKVEEVLSKKPDATIDDVLV